MQTYFQNDIEKLIYILAPEALETFKEIKKGPVNVKSIKFYKSFDDLYEKSTEAISCHAGCNYCCYYFVSVSATEVFAMAEAIAKMPSKQQDLIKSRIKTNADISNKLSQQQYTSTNIECAMLIDGQCSIYSFRPIACRGHHSMDVQVCKHAFDDVESTAPAPKDLNREIVFRAFDNLQSLVNHQNEVDTAKYELHAALHEAISNTSSFKRWKLGKLAFPSVRNKMTLDEMQSNEK